MYEYSLQNQNEGKRTTEFYATKLNLTELKT